MITFEYKDYYNFDEKGEILTKKPCKYLTIEYMRFLIETDGFERRVRIKTSYITGKTETFNAFQNEKDIVFLIYNNAVYSLIKPFYEIIETEEKGLF